MLCKRKNIDRKYIVYVFRRQLIEFHSPGHSWHVHTHRTYCHALNAVFDPYHERANQLVDNYR